MQKFALGFLVAIIFSALVLFLFLRFGMMDPRADMPVSEMERGMAMPSLDAAVERRAPAIKNPMPPTDENLIAGMKVYQKKCALCHGDVHQPHAELADTMYPRPPQFAKDAADMADNQNFYIIQHGIRMSGMPGWKNALSSQEIWQTTTFLSNMNKLPRQVSDKWKQEAGGTLSDPDIPAPSGDDVDRGDGMKMPKK